MLTTLQNPLKCRSDWNKDYGQVYVFYIVRSQVTLTTANSAICLYAEIAAILDCMVYNRIYPLIYWLLIFNCSIITYFIPASFEKLPCFKASFIEFMYVLNHMVLNWLKEFITLGVYSVLHHNLAQCVWLLYRELDTLLHL